MSSRPPLFVSAPMRGRFFVRSIRIHAICAFAALAIASMRGQTLEPLNPGPNAAITSAAVQPDGKIIVGGLFTQIGAQPRQHLARINADGTLDATLNVAVGATPSDAVTCIAVQPDGAFIIGGAFTSVAGQARGNIARITAAGALDASFNPQANAPVRTLVFQADGKLVVGGNFTTIGGQSRTRLARFNPNGSLDPTFNASADGEVRVMLLQRDGKIVIGGIFNQVNDEGRSNIARLNADGSLDTTFTPNINGPLGGLSLQPDGRIIAVGSFSTVDGQPRVGYARLLATNGALDTSFVPPVATTLNSVAIQADGRLLASGVFDAGALTGANMVRLLATGSVDGTFDPVTSSPDPGWIILDPQGRTIIAGFFSQVEGQARTNIARLQNPTAASSTLAANASGTVVSWEFTGSSPLPAAVYFQSSLNGTTWTDLGFGTYVGTRWELANPALPAGTSQLRAFGVVSVNGSDSSLIMASAQANVTPSAPVIVTQPSSQNVSAGSSVTFTVGAAGTGPVTYQWRFNATDIPGATGASYTLPSAQLFHAGTYTVFVSNAQGNATSDGAVLTVTTPASSGARLLNLSARALTQTGDDVTIPSFVIGGSTNKQLLVRGVGPSLAPFVDPSINLLANPRIALKRRDPNTGVFSDVTSNENWGSNPNVAEIQAAADSVGATSLATNSLDAGLLVDLAPGTYSVVTDDASADTGVVLMELYDLDSTSANSSLINISNRGFVGAGDYIMIPGFSISSEGPLTLLIRAVGPTLADFGVDGAMADPTLTLYQGTQPLFSNDDWSAGPDAAHIATVADQVFAFTLPNGSKDAAMVVTLAPGVYTVHASGKNGATGVVNVEVYVVQ